MFYIRFWLKVLIKLWTSHMVVKEVTSLFPTFIFFLFPI